MKTHTPHTIYDEWLILSYKSGSKKAFNILVKRWNTRLLNRAYLLTKNQEASQDIVQTTWQTALKQIHKLNDPRKFSSWIYTIVSRRAYDWIKFQQKERSVKEQFSETTTASEKEDIYNLSNYIQALPTKDKTILTLFYLDQKSVKEISKLLDISVGTVKSRLFYSREKLKTLIQKEVSYETRKR